MRKGWVQRWRAARADRERGAVLVEAAIMIPLVLGLTFGMIEYGFAFNEQGTVRAGTRTAARASSAVPSATTADFYEAALSTLDTSVHNLANGRADEVWIYQAEEVGGNFQKPATCGVANCVTFKYVGDPDTGSFSRTPLGDTWDPGERHACDPADTDRVGVYLVVEHTFLTEVRTLNLTSNTIMALEPSPAGC
ncbi:MAG TPA: TadE/TadG family type IV pilus assembly protein [Acidimicrobiia bacterium]|nr:TadE/TadG family type IV pilus assembly protein [Acidimicrobiia bacterium]